MSPIGQDRFFRRPAYDWEVNAARRRAKRVRQDGKNGGLTAPRGWDRSLLSWNVHNGAGIAVKNHVVREPIDLFIAVLVDVGVANIRGAHIFLN